MPSVDVTKYYTPDQLQAINDSVFGKLAEMEAEKNKPQPTPAEVAYGERNSAFQEMLNSRKQVAEQARTDSVKMARYNALGNLLTSLVQPIGWGIGGGKGATGGVQPYDNRAYLDAFNRAVKATDELRSIGTKEAEYKFQLADEKYRRELGLEDEARRRQNTIEDEERRAKIKAEAERQTFERRAELEEQKIQGRIKVNEENAKAKMRFHVGGRQVSDSVRDNLLKRANAAYAAILQDYNKKKMAGIEGLQEPPSYDEFVKKFAYDNDGVSVTDTTRSSSSSSASKPAQQTTDFSSYKRGANNANKPVTTVTTDFSQYKRN